LTTTTPPSSSEMHGFCLRFRADIVVGAVPRRYNRARSAAVFPADPIRGGFPPQPA